MYLPLYLYICSRWLVYPTSTAVLPIGSAARRNHPGDYMRLVLSSKADRNQKIERDQAGGVTCLVPFDFLMVTLPAVPRFSPRWFLLSGKKQFPREHYREPREPEVLK